MSLEGVEILLTHKTDRKNEITIRISGLSNGLHDYHFTVEPSTLSLDSNFNKNVEIDVQLDKTSHQIYIKSNIETSGKFQCDRCFDEYDQPLAASYGMCYVYDSNDVGKFPPEELQVISHDLVSIDISEDVRQMILLSIPLKLLCGENCKGLCPQCGKNLNRQSCDCKTETKDPRWQGLQDLLHQ